MFLAELPHYSEQLLHTFSRIEKLTINQQFDRARSIKQDQKVTKEIAEEAGTLPVEVVPCKPPTAKPCHIVIRY